METVPHNKLPLEIKIWALYRSAHNNINNLCEKRNVMSCLALWLNRNMGDFNNMQVCTPVVHRSQSTWEAQLIQGSGHLSLSRQKESITTYFSWLRCNRWNPSAVCALSQAVSQMWRTRWFDFIRSWTLLLGPRYYAYDPSRTSLRKNCTPRHC